MKPVTTKPRRAKGAIFAGVLTAGVTLAALVGSVGAAEPEPTDPTTTVAPTTEAPTTETPTTQAPTTEVPTTVAPLDEAATLGEPSRNGCTVTIPVTVGAAGTYTLQVWDDHVQVGNVPKSFAAGASGAFVYTITKNVGTEAVGVDFQVFGPSGDELDEIDNWDFPGSDDVMASCASSGGVSDHATGSSSSAAPATAVHATPKFTG